MRKSASRNFSTNPSRKRDGLTLQNAHALELFKNEGLAPDAQKRIAKFFDKHKPKA